MKNIIQYRGEKRHTIPPWFIPDQATIGELSKIEKLRQELGEPDLEFADIDLPEIVEEGAYTGHIVTEKAPLLYYENGYICDECGAENEQLKEKCPVREI